jgi:replicative DNA helicase
VVADWLPEEEDPSVSEPNPFHEVRADIPAVKRERVVDGETFVFGEDTDDAPALWGHGDAPLWTPGEGLMIVAPEGVGKTTIAQQLTLAHIGLRDGTLLGMPVEAAAGRVLYIAADRPKQAMRSLKRMVSDADREALCDRLVVHRGPLAHDLGSETTVVCLTQLAQEQGASTVVVDSLKDVAVGLTKDEIGAVVNQAFQNLIAAGIELVVLHHPRKANADNKKPNKLSDVYGSRWLTAGMGSVVLIWGEAGDTVVELTHLKQPLEDVGRLTLVHDHATGTTTVEAEPTPYDLVAATRRSGLTVADAAAKLERSDSRNAIERARRKLNKLVDQGRVERRDDEAGTVRYYAKRAA